MKSPVAIASFLSLLVSGAAFWYSVTTSQRVDTVHRRLISPSFDFEPTVPLSPRSNVTNTVHESHYVSHYADPRDSEATTASDARIGTGGYVFDGGGLYSSAQMLLNNNSLGNGITLQADSHTTILEMRSPTGSRITLSFDKEGEPEISLYSGRTGIAKRFPFPVSPP